jgi:hypothetical protein
MFSVENLYYVLYCNLFKKIKADIIYFWLFGSIDINDLTVNFGTENRSSTCFYHYDQEPVQEYVLDNIFAKYAHPNEKIILVASEYSNLVEQYCRKNEIYNIYYFFHGFACLDWYNDCKFFTKEDPIFSNKFLSFNRLCTQLRSHRLLFVSELQERKIMNKGMVSLQIIKNDKNVAKKEIADPNSKLSKKSKIKIYTNLAHIKNNYIIDKEVTGAASAHLGVEEFTLWQSCFLHIVSETVFFDRKLHLTEKIFKPIVSQRPFILLGAYKNLEYLKSYGFKTFDKWIDESYDSEPDNEKRLMMVCDQVEKIAMLPEDKIEEMYWDMKEVLEHNYRHFYTDFKKIIVDELVDNFEGYMLWHNKNNPNDQIYNIESLNLPEVKKLLAQ